jgi:predicted Zn-dependent protease
MIQPSDRSRRFMLLSLVLGLVAVPAAGGEPKKPPDDPLGQWFDWAHKVTQSLDEAGQAHWALTPDEEQQFGRRLHEEVRRLYKLPRKPPAADRVQRLAEPILPLRTQPEAPCRFFMLPQRVPNAFSHAGGYVYVTQGLLDFVQSDAELQFLLAHEIAHGELGHLTKRITYAARAAEVGGEPAAVLTQRAYLAVALGYTEENEFEADAWALRALRQIGRSRDESLAMLRHLAKSALGRALDPKRSPPRTDAERASRQIEDHFRSHPPTAERLRRLEGAAP